jgi:nucleotide-binding universal stress UspA family protein
MTPEDAFFVFRTLRDPRIRAEVERLAPMSPDAALALRLARARDRESESRRVELPVVRVVREVLSRPGVLDDLRASGDDPIARKLLKVAEQLGIEG